MHRDIKLKVQALSRRSHHASVFSFVSIYFWVQSSSTGGEQTAKVIVIVKIHLLLIASMYGIFTYMNGWFL